MLFILFVPFVLAASIPGNWTILPYVVIWSLIELVIDYNAYKPHSYKHIQAIITTFSFNLTILFGSSLIILSTNQVLDLTGTPWAVSVSAILGVYVFLISKLEDLIDYSIYK